MPVKYHERDIPSIEFPLPNLIAAAIKSEFLASYRICDYIAAMATTIKTKVPLVFDQAKLQNMVEPLTVRVEKKRANGNQPVPIPGKDGGRSGTGWSRDEVLDLENWILTDWAGGGYYRFQVTDADGTVMFWEAAFDPRIYPEKIPQAQQSAAAVTNTQPVQPGVAVNPSAPQAVPVQSTPLGGNPSQWPPPSAALYPGVVVSQQAQQPPGQPQQPQPQPQWPPTAPSQQFMGYSPTGQPIWSPQASPWGVPAAPWGAPTASWGGSPYATSLRNFGRSPREDRRPSYVYDEDRERREREEKERHEREEKERRDREDKARLEAERKQYEDRLRVMDEQLRQRETLQKESEHKAALERQQQQYASELAAMRDEMRRLGEHRSDQENVEVRRAREEQARLEREQTRLERERERDQISMQFRSMQEMIAKVAEKPTEDPRMRTLEMELAKQREDQRVLQEHQQRERERWEAQRAQEALITQTQRDREALAQQMKEQEHRTQELLREATANKTDPMVEFMKENGRLGQEQARLQAENMREIARMQQMGSDRMASMMMTPQALASLIKDSGQGADMLMKNMIGSFSGIFDTFRGAVDQIVQLSGGTPEPPSVRLIEQGISKASDMAERYFGAKAAQAQSDAQVKATQIQADAHIKTTAMRAQAQAQATAAAVAQQAQQAQQQRAATRQDVDFTTDSGHVGPERRKNGQTVQAGLSGAAATPPAAPVAAPRPSAPPRPGKPQAPKPPIDLDDGLTDPVTGQTIPLATIIPIKRSGRTDTEWFGPALESVGRLRVGVGTFLTNLQRIQNGEQIELGKEGEVPGLNPDQAIDAILKGVNYVTMNGIAVLAFDELFRQGMFAEFLDVMLPDAPQLYKDDCVKILTEEVEVNAAVAPAAGAVIEAAFSEDADDGDQDQPE